MIISIIIYVFTNFCIQNINVKINKIKFKANFVATENIIFLSNNPIKEVQATNDISSNNSEEISNTNIEMQWYIQIDKINLKAPIAEGTSKEILDDFVGHFEETQIEKGNVGLAAHNRGYKNNYFNRIKELKVGDEIKYCYNQTVKKYQVTKHEIIENTNWDNLKDTEEEILTLITCVENEPNYRRCIQGERIE
ncbi:MAG: class D sortase [Clostridia bacterium]